MDSLELWYPVKPLHINQPFGANPADYAKFLDRFNNPEKGHMGVDFMAVHGQPVYASADGIAQYIKDEHGGEGVWLNTGPADYAGGTCWFQIIYWHLVGDTDVKFPPPIPMGGVKTKVKVGDLIGYANNTGTPYESSGDHLHVGLIPINSIGNALLPANGFNGCIDPTPYFNNYFAIDNVKVLSTFQQIINDLKSIIGLK